MAKQSNNRHDAVTIESRDLELINVQNICHFHELMIICEESSYAVKAHASLAT